MHSCSLEETEVKYIIFHKWKENVATYAKMCKKCGFTAVARNSKTNKHIFAHKLYFCILCITC